MRNISESAGVARQETRDLLDGLNQRDRARRKLPDRSDHLGMVGVADQHDLATTLVVDFGLAMHFGDERARCVQREQIAFFRLCWNRLWHAVS